MKVARTASALVSLGRRAVRRPCVPARRPGTGGAGAGPPVAKLVAEPASLTLRTGESVDSQGHGVRRGGQSRFPTPSCASTCRAGRRHLCRRQGDGLSRRRVHRDGGRRRARPARRPGDDRDSGDDRRGRRSPRSRSRAEPGRLYTGVTLAHGVKGTHADGSERPGRDADVAKLRSVRGDRRSLRQRDRAQARRGHDHRRGRRRQRDEKLTRSRRIRWRRSIGIKENDDSHR